MHSFSSFLNGGKQDLSCIGKTQTARVDKARAVKVEAVLWGNKTVRRQRMSGVVETGLVEIRNMDQWQEHREQRSGEVVRV